jgi:hypothetical protein
MFPTIREAIAVQGFLLLHSTAGKASGDKLDRGLDVHGSRGLSIRIAVMFPNRSRADTISLKP